MNSNTEIITMNKKIARVAVTGVRIGGEARKVRFIAKNGQVICRSRGLKTFKVRQAEDGSFFVKLHGNREDYPTAKTPAKAFAAGVNAFWN